MSVRRPESEEADDDTLVRRIVDAVATVRETQPKKRSPPLYEAVDPDALKRLVQRSDRRDLEVRFDYHGCRVTVEGDGSVTVTPHRDCRSESR